MEQKNCVIISVINSNDNEDNNNNLWQQYDNIQVKKEQDHGF
jgi:hypothetical protein